MEPRVERTDINYLRPHQVADVKEEIKSAEAKLQSPYIEDKAEVAKQLRRLKKMADEQTPKPPANGNEEGRLVARSKALLSKIVQGMPTAEEMRKAPPGAVDKHMDWEKCNKADIIEWKNIQLRLKPDEREAANLERHRPAGNTLSMDNAYIPGQMFFMPPAGAGTPVVFSDEQIAVLRTLSPQLADSLAVMSRDQRQEVKEALTGDGAAGIGLDAEARSQASIHGSMGVIKREALKAERNKDAI